MSSPRSLVAQPKSVREGSRARRWALAVGVTVIVAIGIVLLFLLTQATGNRELYERNYGRLFVLNLVVGGLLAAVILWVMLRLVSRVRRASLAAACSSSWRPSSRWWAFCPAC